jgi:Domain of Unknown Function (DUF349)
MAIFSRIFRTAAPTAGEPADPLASSALGGDEEATRIASIHKLPDGEALRSLAGVGKSPGGVSFGAVNRAAQARIAALVDAGSIDFASLSAEISERSSLFAVAALCQDAGHLIRELALIVDPEQLARLVMTSPSSRVRQLAAERVDDPEQMRQLLKQIGNKDKSVHKILKQKRDALHDLERKTQQSAQEVSDLCAAIERHSRRSFDAFYTAAFEHLRARWLSLSAPKPDNLEKTARQALERCGEVIALQQRESDQRAAHLAAQQAIHDAEQRARRAAQEAAAAQADLEAQVRSETSALREAEEAARAHTRAAQEQLSRQIGGLIRMANAALSDGGTQRAAGLRRAIEEKLSLAAALPTYITRQVQTLDEKLNELKQWKDYAVAPKRIELIEEMESLIGASEEPKILADRIKSLQQEWRTISKGIVSDASGEWERFHQASQAAYQPCHEYFEAQAKLRQANIERRQAVLGRLTVFESTQTEQNPDWRLLLSVLREAPVEWRSYSPVDRDAGRAIQQQFDASLARLQAMLDAWYQRNVADKQALVIRARHLLTQEDSRAAIEAVKRLQILWKDTGPAPRSQEQSLWSEFREVCDSVYEKRQQAYAEYAAALEGNKSKAVALCEEAERAGALSGTDLIQAASKIPEWRTAFAALDEMPRAEARAIETRFERALDLCSSQVARQRTQDAQQAFTNLFEAGRSIQAYAWAVARGMGSVTLEPLRQTAENFIASGKHWPKGSLKVLKETLAKVGSMTDADIAANEKALRTLCIRCEIITETSTPPEDEKLRREYQVQRLMQAMGQGSSADDVEWDAISLEWIRSGAVAPEIYEGVRERFMRCWAKKPVQSSEQTSFRQASRSDERESRDTRPGQGRRHGRDGSRSANAR